MRYNLAPTVRFQFEPHDLWVGIFWRINYNLIIRLQVYICILPCFPILLTFSRRHT